jgi:hypothetical protein
MKSLIYIVFAAALLSAAAFTAGTSAAGFPQLAAPALQAPAALKVRQERCALWRRVCRVRWSHGWRYRRCMTIHACLP